MFLASRSLLGAFAGAHLRHVAQRRAVSFILPTIPQLEELKISQKGYNGLLSNKSVNELWFKHGQELLNRLNAQLVDKKIENPPASLSELITLSFANPDLNEVYTYGSKLYNLQFAFESLTPVPESQGTVLPQKAPASALLETPTIATKFDNEPRDPELVLWIVDSFGSIPEFRALLLNSANAIKGDGVTWLFAQATFSDLVLNSGTDASAQPTFDQLGVVNTYNGGIIDDAIRSGQLSKMKQARKAKQDAVKRRQEQRKEITEGDNVEASGETEPVNSFKQTVLGTLEEAEEAFLYSDRRMVPLLAIDASMKWYLPDYGVYGKLDYLDNVWKCINWDVVAQRAPPRYKPSVVFDK